MIIVGETSVDTCLEYELFKVVVDIRDCVPAPIERITMLANTRISGPMVALATPLTGSSLTGV